MKRKYSYLIQSVIFISLISVFVSSCKTEDPEPVMEATGISFLSGDNQSATVGTELIDFIKVVVTDQNGDFFEGATVHFELTEGSLSSTTETTNVGGEAAVKWTLGTTVGTQTLTVTAFKADGTTHITGSPLTFTATGTAITVTDVNGNTYQAVIIGEQVWMAENLKTTNYDNAGTAGAEIPLVTDNTVWADFSGNAGDKAYCYYNNNANEEKNTYGALYTYDAATNGDNSGSNVQGICPTGWHLPNDTEWSELITYLGGNTVAGGKMKEAGMAHWESPNEGATNESGFTALPSGFRTDDTGEFITMGVINYWWSATQENDYRAWNYKVRSASSWIDHLDYDKSMGFSVRCVQD